MIWVKKESLEIDRNTKILISRLNYVLSMLVNLSLAIDMVPSEAMDKMSLYS